ncbi:MAG: PIN domain-containing protein [Chloroflexota bacterium]|nr:PIN domain-containing protein [Chloroflexota bacterium]
MALPFLDTNILLRHLLQDHPQHSPRATAYLARIERGELQVRTADTVIFETVFTLQRSYRHPKAAIGAALMPLIDLPGIILPGKRRFHRVFDLYVNLNLPFADAYHVVAMERSGLREIVTFDQELDRVPGIKRVEP